jgi:hypothetical protein
MYIHGCLPVGEKVISAPPLGKETGNGREEGPYVDFFRPIALREEHSATRGLNAPTAAREQSEGTSHAR